MMISEKTISIVIPVYNSEKTIGTLVEQLQSILNGKYKFDIILINDGSQDRSFDVLKDISIRYDNIKVLDLSRNFGQHNAIMAGFNYADGDYVVTMDDDLQHPPEEILKLIKEIENGHDVVYGQYVVKQHSFFKNFGSEVNNVMANILIKKPKEIRFTSFRIIKSYVISEIQKYEAPFPYLDGLIIRITRNISNVSVNHKKRANGKTNYTFIKMFGLWFNGFLNFSIVPLRLFSYIGFVFASFGFLFAIKILLDKLFFSTPMIGWTSLIVAILIFSGVQLISIGLVGEYIGRIFLTQNKTPQYIIKNKINVD